MKRALFLLLISSSICFAQTKYDRHEKLISEAYKLKNSGDYDKAILTYGKALEVLIPNSSTPYFNAAECALQLDNPTLADKWIRKGVSQGGAQMEYLRKYQGFKDIQDADFYKRIISDYNSLRQEYFSTLENIDVYLEIEELTARDQFVRHADLYLAGYSNQDYQNAGDGFRKAQAEKDSVAFEKYKKILFMEGQEEHENTVSELMRRVDSLNVARLMEITKEYGWQERAWIILWHQRGTYGQDNYVWNYFKPLINKEIEEGKLSRSFWGPFDQFKKMMDTGDMGTITIGEKPEKEIEVKKEKIKG